MNALNKKLLVLGMLTSMMIGCASTDPYTAQSNDDFVYDSNMSFAMNVVDGSLGFHNGLRDTDAPKNSDTTPGALDYAADGIIGAAFGGGLGGGLLSMLGTNKANEPLHTYYGIVYYPIDKKGNIQNVFDNIENDRIVIPSRGTTTATVPQLVSTHLNSFNNKKVGKVVMYKQSQSAVNYELNNADLQNGALDSIGCYKETTQVRVNGANVFAKNGVSKPNQRLARLVDAWGDGSLQTFANGVAYKCPDTESREDIIQAGNASVGFMDWFGVDLGYQAIESLQIEFGRTAVFCKTNAGTTDAAQTARSKYNAALNLIMFAMTQKSIVVDGKGGYDIRYL